MSVNKLVLLKLVNSCSAANKNSLQQARTNGDDGVLGKAVLVLKVDGDSASIENSRPVKISSHQAWTTFQETCKRLLSVKEALIFRLEEEPGRTVKSLTCLIDQPSNAISLHVSEITRNPIVTKSCSPSNGQKGVDFSSVDQVLHRTRELCQSLTMLCPRERRVLNQAIRGVRSLENIQSCSPTPTVKSTYSLRSAVEICDEDIEDLLQMSESMTEVSSGLSSETVLPDAPTKLSAQRNFKGGYFILWDPVKLDGHDRNNGHRVEGYLVTVNGQQMASTQGPLSCQVELNGLVSGKDYVIRVCTCCDSCTSAFSQPHCLSSRPSNNSSPASRCHSVRSSRSPHFSFSEEDYYSMNSGATPNGYALRCHSNSIRSSPQSSRSSSPSSLARYNKDDDVMSNVSRSTSGVCVDLSPNSSKSGISRSRHTSTSPSPLTLKSHKPKNSLEEDPTHSKPLPPTDIKADLNGHILSVSWKPIRPEQGNHGNRQLVLGYRVYVNGSPVNVVDGIGCRSALIELPTVLLGSRLEVDVRSRTISNESSPCPISVYTSDSSLQSFCIPQINDLRTRCETCV